MSSSDFAASEDIVVSTERLRLRLLQEDIDEPIIKDCETIMLTEVSELQNQLKALQRKHIILLDTLRQLEVFDLLSTSVPWYIILLVSYRKTSASLEMRMSCCDVNLVL